MGFYISPEGNAVAEMPDDMVTEARERLARLLQDVADGKIVPQVLIDEARSIADWTDAPPERIAAHNAAMARTVWFSGAPDPADANAYAAWTEARAMALAAVDPTELPYAKSAVMRDLANLRWRRETGGTVVAGLAVPTDDKTQSKLQGAVLAAMLDANYTVQWKLADGSFARLNSSQIVAVAQGVRAHVQACFDYEAGLSAQIESAATPAALAAIDIEAGWPA